MNLVRQKPLSVHPSLRSVTASKSSNPLIALRPGALNNGRNASTSPIYYPARPSVGPTALVTRYALRSMSTSAPRSEGATADKPKHLNRLSKAKSPYLLQHAENPVRCTTVEVI